MHMFKRKIEWQLKKTSGPNTELWVHVHPLLATLSPSLFSAPWSIWVAIENLLLELFCS